MPQPHITVFTPTYNRASKLYRVFNSLINQTYKNFEWLIVDDGSNDNTKSIVESFQISEPYFPIRYFYQSNAGKHIAINNGVKNAKGEWFLIADSDDEIVPEALSVFMKTWEKVPADKKDTFCGIIACCKNQFGERISDFFHFETFDGRFRELFYKKNFRKELFQIYKISVLKDFSFPENIRNCYYPEGILWRKITDKYLVRIVNSELRIYYVNEDEDSIMSSSKKNIISNAMSNCIESSDVLNRDLKYFIYRPLYFFKIAMVYHTFKLFLNRQQKQIVKLRFMATFFSVPFILPAWIYFYFKKL